MACLPRRTALGFAVSCLMRQGSASAASTAVAQPGDVFAATLDPGAPSVRAADIAADHKPVRVWAVDPQSRAARKPTPFGQILLVRLAPGALSHAERLDAADGIVAYSAICTHAGCIVLDWRAAERQFVCPCHRSVYDAAEGGRVVFGPAPRPLPALPVRIVGGVLMAAGPFSARIGGSTGRTD